MKELIRILKPLRIKLILETWLKWFIRMETAAFFLILLVSLYSKYKAIPDLHFILFGIGMAAFLLSILVLFWDRVSYYKTARIGDKLGYEERLTTAIELLEHDREKSLMEQLAVKDALETGRQVPPIQKKYQIHLSKKLLMLMVILFLACFAVGFIPNPGAEIEEMISDELERVEETKKSWKENQDFTQEEWKELNKELNTMMKNIKLSKTKGDAIKAIQNTQQEMKKLEKKSVAEELKKMGEALSQNESTSSLGEALKQGDASSIEQGIEKLNQEMETMTPEKSQELMEVLQEAAEQMENQEQKEMMNQYAQEAKKGNGNAQTNGSQKLTDSLKKAAAKNASLKKEIEKLNEAMAEMNQKLQGEQAQTGQKGQKAENASNQEGSQQSEEGQGQDQGDGKGQGQGQGQGNGEGQGQGQSQGDGEGQGQGRGTGHSKPEEIFTRQAQDKAGYETKIEGTESESGETEQTKQKTVGNAGESISYEAVYSSYREDALKQMEQMDIPYGMKTLVEEYFSTLEK